MISLLRARVQQDRR